MRHIHSLEEADIRGQAMVTIGMFDGVHRGHQRLVRQLVEEGQKTGCQTVVLSFFPHPDVVLRGLRGRYYLSTPAERAEALGRLGVDYVISHPFNADVQHVRAADFVDRMVQHLKLAALWVGADFALGYKREGNLPFLRAQGVAKGFEVRAVELTMNEGGQKISSEAIRQAVASGQVEQAREWLGYSYALSGEVVHGEARGRTIGFPTANTAVWGEQVIPANGIYASWAYLGAERFMAATNVGVRPTFDDGDHITIEPYLLDFDRDIYGQTLRITFEKFLRPEAKFDGLPALIAQIQRDVEDARAYLQGG